MSKSKDFDPNKLPQQYDDLYSLESGMNIAMTVVHCWVTTIAAYTRRSFGSRYVGLMPVLFLIVPIYFAFTQESEVETAIMFVFVFGSLLLMGLNTSRDQLDRRPIHSRYGGWPRVCDWLSVSEYAAKAFYEPVLVAVVGGVFLWLGVPSLGWYLVLGGCMMSGSYRMAREQVRRQATDIRDAELYGSYLDNEVEQL